MLQVSLIPNSYDIPIKVIALWDTGASSAILNPSVLPNQYWQNHTQLFKAANGDLFTTNLISKPIKLQFFPGLTFRHKFLGSFLPGKDLVLGWDIIQQLNSRKAFLTRQGLKFKSYFQPFSSSHNLFSIQTSTDIVNRITMDCSSSSHSEFILKCDHPLTSYICYGICCISTTLPYNSKLSPFSDTWTIGMLPTLIELFG